MTNNWVQLKRVASINDRSLPEDTDPERQLRYIDISSVGPGKLVGKPTDLRFGSAPTRARRLVRPGDTIVSTVRTYLRAVWPVVGPTDDIVVSTGFAVLTPRAVDPQFFSWWVRSNTFVDEVVANSVGVSYPAINPSDLETLKIRLPSPHEQQAIARFLDTEVSRIDALLSRKRRLSEVVWERFRSAISLHTRARTVPTLNSTSSVRILPNNWHVMKLKRCFASVTYGIGDATREAGEIAVLGMANVGDHGRITGEVNGYMNSVDSTLLLQEGDLLFNRTNSLTKVGKIGLVREISQPTTFASYLVRMRASRLALPEYLNYLLNTDEMLGLARASALPSIGQANLNPARYGDLRVAIPPIAEQRRIVAILAEERERCEAIAEHARQQADLFQERKRALITAAVTGRLDIPGVVV